MEIYFICGVFIGAIATFIYFRFKKLNEINTQLNDGQALLIEKQNLLIENQKLQNEKESLLSENGELGKKLVQIEVEYKHLNEKLVLYKTETEKTQQQNKAEVEKTQLQMVEKFENLAQRIFEEKTQKFSTQSTTNLKLILDPIKDQMKSFEKKIEDSYSTDRVERGTLKGEISKLIDLNVRMSNETENLTKALKGDKKTQGFWGELILETLLEKSGLRKDEEYFLQGGGMALRNLDNSLLKPDVLVKLPDQKFIVVDSKVSLVAFEQYMSNEEQGEKAETFAKEHLESIKRHIDGLGAKKYHALDELDSPEMTLLFMPIEPAFALAVKLQPDLITYAWDRQITIVSPTTLLTTLKTIASVWKQEKQNRNTLEIAKAGGQLYEKFCGLLDDLQALGQRIDQTHDAYTNTINKLGQGKGNLIRQVERLKALGAKTEKNLLDNKITQKLVEDQDLILTSTTTSDSLTEPISELPLLEDH
jgi:DNA recombination protein RmuC